ncbi:MAG: tetratricopeptide repeat protein [Isosphaeraceae bacterium]|nr:tetratricopeptide repeat protein [Isosphaeraceae bacterium]
MRVRSWVWTALAISATALLGWVGWKWLSPPPTIEPVLRLIEARRLEEAEAQLRKLLDIDPGNARCHLLVASIELDRSNRLGHLDTSLLRDALSHVRRVSATDKRLFAEARLVEGKVCERLDWFDEAEAALSASFALDPTSEAGWRLLGLYDEQDRRPEGRALAKRLYHLLPRPDSKRAALVELVREEVHQPAAAGIIARFSPVTQANPGDFRSRLALGRALAREGRPDEGLPLLRSVVEKRPDDRAAREALLTALEDAGQVDALQPALEEARARGVADNVLARFEGWLAQERNDWKSAIVAYQRAEESDGYDVKLEYRLSRALRLAGNEEEATRVERRIRSYQTARKALRQLFETREAELRDHRSHPELFQQIADLRERMGYRDEARGWHVLVLREDPGNPVSQAAVERLK